MPRRKQQQKASSSSGKMSIQQRVARYAASQARSSDDDDNYSRGSSRNRNDRKSSNRGPSSSSNNQSQSSSSFQYLSKQFQSSGFLSNGNSLSKSLTPLRKTSQVFLFLNAPQWRKSLSKVKLPFNESDDAKKHNFKWKVNLFLDRDASHCSHLMTKKTSLQEGIIVMLSIKAKEWMDYCPTLFGLEMDEYYCYLRDQEMERRRLEAIAQSASEEEPDDASQGQEADADESAQTSDAPPQQDDQQDMEPKDEASTDNDAEESSFKELSEEEVAKLPSFFNRLVYIHWPASKFLLNGADLMAPGIAHVMDIKSVQDQQKMTEQKRDEISNEKKKKDLMPRSNQIWCLIFVVGNDFPMAMGRWVAKGQDLSSGVAVEIVHRYGDAIWNHGVMQGIQAPAGFKRSIVQPVTGDMDEEDDSDQHNTEEDEQPEEPLEPLTQNEQDNLLKQLFLMVVKQTPDSEFPLNAAILYTKMLQHPCNIHSQANIKASSWKKLAKFMKDMSKQKYVKGKIQRNEFNVHSVNRSHPEFASIPDTAPEAPSGSHKKGGQSSQKAAKSSSNQKKMTIIPLFKFPSNMVFLIKDPQMASTKEVFTSQQVGEIVSQYLEPYRKGRFVEIPDELFHHIVVAYKNFSKRVSKQQRKGMPSQRRDATLKNCPDPEKNPKNIEIRFVKALVEERLTAYHGIQYDPDSPMKITSGSPKYLEVQISKIMGNKVITKVRNLSLFNIPYQQSSFQSQLQKKMSSSVKVDPEENWELSIQGSKADQVTKFLEKEWGFDTKFIHVENLAHKGKKKRR